MSAGPTFSKIAEQIIKLPDSDILANFIQENKNYVKAPDCLGKTYQSVLSILKTDNIEAKFINLENTFFIFYTLYLNLLFNIISKKIA